MVGMLVVGQADLRDSFLAIGFLRGAGLFDVVEMKQRGMLALHAHLVPELDLVRLVERADRDRDVRATERAIVERGSAIGTKAARRQVRAVELSWLAVRPGQMLMPNAHQRGK